MGTSSETSKLPTSRTTTKETLSPSNQSRNQSRLSALEERYSSLCPMESYYVLAAAGPLAKDESCPGLATQGSAEERRLNPLATLGHAASAPAPTGCQSLTTPSSAAQSSRLSVLRSSTTCPYPIGSNASVTQLSHPPHRRALHVSIELIQEPRVRS